MHASGKHMMTSYNAFDFLFLFLFLFFYSTLEFEPEHVWVLERKPKTNHLGGVQW